jgi:hypothetical protein
MLYIHMNILIKPHVGRHLVLLEHFDLFHKIVM